MKIQISRNSKQKSKHYSSVCHQQGRMLTDSDLTEQALISRDRLSDALRDVIGSGTPRHDGLVRIAEDGSPGLYWGRVYVDGVPAEVLADNTAVDASLFDYSHQLFYPEAPPLPDSEYRLYVDVWERSVIWLEDGMLRDPGLHGADTTARTQTVAQVKWCASDLDPLCEDINPPLGNTRLRLVLRSLATSADPCDPCADELELNEAIGNYLFRTEIHDVHYDDANRPDWMILKWSSENGAEAYKTADVPPDFANSQFVYEYFDDVTEKRLGNHLARDGANNRIIDGLRPDIESDFSATSASAKEYVRRWDGWCKIVKSGSDWQVSEGFEGSIDLSSGIGAGKPGHVIQGGDSVSIELRVITLTLELAELDMIAGDYWTVPVRESVHQQGEVLLEDEVAGMGALPEGELHHYMLLVDVADDESATMQLPSDSDCDEYNACQLAEFPSLTDLRADDICFDNQICAMPEVNTVQGALDYLCQQNDLPWHNKHLHGWGIVCGLALECNKEKPQSVILQPGYALDCEGRDMILNKAISINILKLMKEAGIKPGDIDKDKGQGLCLYLETTEEQQLDVGIELYQSGKSDWMDIFSDTLLLDFYQDCVLDLVKVFTEGMRKDDDIIARCALTDCGEKLLAPERRRGLTIANLVFNDDSSNESRTVLNVSACEHALIKDLYDSLQEYLRSKTFCAQFDNDGFPDYPFKGKNVCRGTWFTPESFDHIRLHPNGQIVFGWQRNSSRVFVFKQLKENCLGDLIGYFDLPKLEDGTITDLAINEKGIIHISAIVHQEDTMFMRGQFVEPEGENCEIKIKWLESFICGVKITNLELSPWSGNHLYAVALCQGVYAFELDKLFENEKIESKPNWIFPASGHIKFDKISNLVLATAFEQKSAKAKTDISCETGYYNGIVIFNGKPSDTPQLPDIHRLYVNDNLVSGNDGFDISPTTKVSLDDKAAESKKLIASDLQTYVVINENDKKILCQFDLSGITITDDKQRLWIGVKMHSFGVAKKVALRYLATGKLDGVVASRFAMHDLQYIPSDPKKAKKELLPSIPVQAGPIEILANDAAQQLFILNHTGQSITVFNYALSVYQKERTVLAQYRAEVIAAFFQLTSGVVQYLKDCFCHHLLVNCPQCDDDDKVYLGCLSVENNEVYNICNFTKRKYVKTFPTVSYWLSIIPVEGLVSWLVEKICCFIMPEYTRKNTDAFVSVSPMAMNMTKAALRANPAMFASTLSSKGGDVLQKEVSNIIGLGISNNTELKDTVKNEYNYKPGVFVEDKVEVITKDKLLEKMDVIDQGQFNNTQDVANLNADMEKLQQEKIEMEERFSAMDMEKQAAEAKVAELEKQLSAMKTEAQSSNKRFAELEKGLSEFESMRKELQPIIAGAKSVSTISGITEKNLELLEQNNIRTVSTLATMSQEKLVELGMHTKTAASLIKKANDKIII